MRDDLAPHLLRVLREAEIVPGPPADGDAPPRAREASVAAAWADVLAVAATELAKVTVSPDAWSEDARARVIRLVDQAVRAAGAAKAPVLVAQEESGSWRRPGVRSFADHRAKTGREDVGRARQETSAARTMVELEGGVAAVANGEMSPSQVQHLARVVDKVDPRVREQLLTGPGAAAVRDLARDHAPKVFARKVEHLAAESQDPAELQDAHEAIRARRFLRLVPTTSGTRVDGLLDPVAGHRLQLALEAASPRPAAEDTRTPDQRRADALETIASTILAHGELAPARHVPHQVMITMTEQTFLAAQRHLATASHARGSAVDGQGVDTPADGDSEQGAGTVADGDTGGDPFPPVRFQDGPLLPPADLAKLLCGSAVGRLVVNAEGVPLNAGRSQRTFKNTLRRTVELRDQHCTWPDCTQVARFCEVHHLDHWDTDHGETDVHRGVLLCSFHHHELHRHDLDLVPATRPPEASSANGVSGGSPPPADGIGGGSPPAAGLRGGSPPPTARTASPLPGDPEYEPPRYELVPRARTADDRRRRLAERLRRGTAARRRERATAH